MTFNPNADVRGSSAKRRGRNAAIAGGGVVGLGAIAVLLLNLFTGQDFSGLLGGGGDSAPAPGAQGETVQNCETGQDANTDDACRLAATQLVLDAYWDDRVEGYRAPGFVIVDGATSSPCGTASNATGPFYCPADETVYIDPTFFGLLQQQFGAEAGSLAQMYVLAHEWGHHIQHITGVMDAHPNNGTGPESNGVRMELQADCYAGAWVASAANEKDRNGVTFLQPPTEAQLRDALNAAATVGDDHIQAQSGRVNPESWTHGSSEQRQRWFATGYSYDLQQCDTFAVAGRDL
ncbi:KPN_02809 family neutral zinc metallopeptidase [Microbacterium sp. No. 7]|uniref:KPN_02809 family neutral zinc metallopeptidase n=1 Tax=Microbacterium sp. No. 7 TaxID=1714373 RepID=UPI0006D1320B|nr:neutral zinc metallopeptidase [Microbacterium sp. No. 7]ALJ22278.1 neutral zinc metallopeptidase [Microbacterium sp. No. 7]